MGGLIAASQSFWVLVGCVGVGRDSVVISLKALMHQGFSHQIILRFSAPPDLAVGQSRYTLQSNQRVWEGREFQLGKRP